MTGVTGAAIKSRGAVGDAVARIKGHTDLPVAVGFGIKTAEDAAEIGRHADGIVVGSVLVDALAHTLVDGKATDRTVAAVRDLVAEIYSGVKRARE
jgi:tryptophan synthase alpha chain